MSDPRIIIGASHAGSELAARLRQLDASTPVLLLGDEPVLPYQRPPLSKSWLGEPDADVDKLLIRNAAAYASAGIETRLDARVDKIDRAAQRVALATGEALAYSQLAIATGARARRLEVPSRARAERAANFHYLRDIFHARRLRAQFVPGARIAIIGGGYIGLEIAALATKYRLRPTILEAQARVLARVTAPVMSTFYEQVHRDAGVDIRTAMQVVDFEFANDGRIRSIVWRGEGRSGVIETDIVVAGIGVEPNVELAKAAGLITVADGLLVDELCRTSDPMIVAAGDCTSRPVPGQSGTVRIESVPNAVEQARTAAAMLCGQQHPCRAVPWFWSDQYDLKLQMAGLSRDHDTVVIRGDMAARAFTAFYLKGDVLIAADSVNRPSDFMLARKFVAAGLCVDAAMLADPDNELKRLAAA